MLLINGTNLDKSLAGENLFSNVSFNVLTNSFNSSNVVSLSRETLIVLCEISSDFPKALTKLPSRVISKTTLWSALCP